MKGHVKAVRVLIESHANVNAATNKRWTPLHQAALKKHKDVVQALIDAGADMSIKNEDNETAYELVRRKIKTSKGATLVDFKSIQTMLAKRRSELSPLHAPSSPSASPFSASPAPSSPSSGRSAATVVAPLPADVARISEERDAAIAELQKVMRELREARESLALRQNFTNLSIPIIEDEDSISEKSGIGMGTFGEVYKAKWAGNDVAYKHFKRFSDSSEECAAELGTFQYEVQLLSNLRHPNIVHMYAAVVTDHSHGIIFKYYARGSLHAVLHGRTPRLPLSRILTIARDIARGMLYLHQLQPPIIHRDLAGRNILIDASWGAVVADFGIAAPKISTKQYTGMRGASAWCAPEVLNGDRYNQTCDVYSYGMVLYEMVAKRIPFQGLSDVDVLRAVAIDNKRPSIPSTCDPCVKDIMQRCWSENIYERPSFAEILSILEDRILQDDMRGPYLTSHCEFPEEFLCLSGSNGAHWTDASSTNTKLRYFELFIDDVCYDTNQFEVLRSLMNDHLHASNWDITRAYALDNEHLTQRFRAQALTMANLLKDLKWFFSAKGYLHDTQYKEWRDWTLSRFHDYACKHGSTGNTGLSVIPVVQGVSTSACWSICKSGQVAMCRDGGYFGKGLYFTSYADYAATYCTPDDTGERCLMVCWLALGCVYPVVEYPIDDAPEHGFTKETTLYAKPLVTGYDSHYVVVRPSSAATINDFIPCSPEDEQQWMPRVYDEFVVEQQAQVLPQYMVFVKPRKS